MLTPLHCLSCFVTLEFISYLELPEVPEGLDFTPDFMFEVSRHRVWCTSYETASHIRVSAGVSAISLLICFSAYVHPGRQEVMANVLWSLPPTWRVELQFWHLGFGSGSALAVGVFWRVNQQVEELSVSQVNSK